MIKSILINDNCFWFRYALPVMDGALALNMGYIGLATLDGM